MARYPVETAVAGNVWQVPAAVGQQVAAGDVLIILEAMKMEIPVEAPCAGEVAELLVAEGDSVEEGQVVAVVVDDSRD